MSLTCPECGTAFDATGLSGRRVVHCPTCGRGIEPTGLAGDDAGAALGPSRTSGLAVLALVCGIASLVAPACLCPAVGFFMLGTGPMAAPAPRAVMAVPMPPSPPVTVTMPDGSTLVIDPATGQPVPVPPPPAPAPPDVPPPQPPDDGGEDG